jgi:hypothetical protein
VAVVIAGSALTWVAIDRAGQQVTGSPQAANTQPAVVGTIGPAPTTPSTTRRPTPTPSPSTGHATTAAPTPTQSAPVSTPKASQPPAVRTVTRTWSGTAGTLMVTCTGRTVRFKSASPNDGWSVERGDASGDAIDVKFESGEAEVQIRATCVGGVPQFHVETGSSSDSTSDN